MRNHIAIITLLSALLGLGACGGEGGGEVNTVDRKPAIQNIANNIIIPAYQNFAVATDNMEASIAAFSSNPTANGLADARADFRTAYLAWQSASQFEFGPADAIALRNAINIFPTNVEQIQSNISSGSYNLDALSNNAAKGFPALDYLLYGIDDSDDGIIAAYANANAAKYLADVAALINSQVQDVYGQWNPAGGNYVATFVELDGTDQGSALGQLVNKFNEDYELNKNFKLGVPSGIKLLGEKFPEKSEGYYSGLSMELMRANYEASQKIFLGNGNGANGIGLDDLLRDHGANQLATDIEAQYQVVFNAMNALSNDFLQEIATNEAGLQQAYDAAQAMVVLTKTEMPSVFGVQISYQDGDND